MEEREGKVVKRGREGSAKEGGYMEEGRVEEGYTCTEGIHGVVH